LFERSLASALKGSMPGIRQVLTRQSVVASDVVAAPDVVVAPDKTL